ncbi:transposase [Finegoldia magna]|uniref:transposase n=1 Tax=Finegoldia magna TaxID=1260 RepID=UPI001CE11496|nr:transposase [Finegoldia magna]MCA5587144.1 transposase [Finegoldia magna]MCA5587363.1 transposase [Finegoldia magna]
MAKYSTELKMKVVKEYLESNTSYKTLSDKYRIPNKSIIITWVNTYKTQGYEGLKVKRKNTKYPLEFKLNVVNLYLTGEMSYQSLANELKISNPAIITRWVNDFRKQGIEGLKPKKRGRPSKMPKSTNKSKDIKIDSSEKLTNLEDNSLTQAQLKEKIKKLEEKNYWLQLENDAIKKKIELSQMTDAEIRQLLKQSGF